MNHRLEEDECALCDTAAAVQNKRPVLPRHRPFCLGGRFYLPYLGGGGPLIDWLHYKSAILKKNEFNIRDRLKIPVLDATHFAKRKVRRILPLASGLLAQRAGRYYTPFILVTR